MNVSAAWGPGPDSLLTSFWFVAWERVGSEWVTGAIAGPSAEYRSLVVADCFLGRIKGRRVTSVNLVDQASVSADNIAEAGGPEAPSEVETAAIIKVAEAAWNTVWEWNDVDVWCETDLVALRKDRLGDVGRGKDGDYILNVDVEARFVADICIGLRYSPG